MFSGGRSNMDSDWLEAVWEFREETVYPRLFGPVSRGIFTLSAENFQPFGDVELDPRWLFCGVLEFGPTASRPTWVYVTSGHSNPWDTDTAAKNDESGAGVEFVLETLGQDDWPIRLLQHVLAFDILLSGGYLGGKEPLGLHDRIPLGMGIELREIPALVRNLIVFQPVSFSHQFELESGSVTLMELIGVTDSERDFARESGFDALKKKMSAAGLFPATVPERHSVV